MAGCGPSGIRATRVKDRKITLYWQPAATMEKAGRAPRLVIDPPGFIRAFDACLWHDPQGRLWLFWAQAAGHWDGRAGVWAITTDDSGSETPQWSRPRRISHGVLMNKPIVGKNGDWLLPIMIWTKPANLPLINERDKLNLSAEHVRALVHDLGTARGANVFSSTDRGEMFTMLGLARFPDTDLPTEHMLIERRDGSLWMLARTRYGIGSSFSKDGGRTWSSPRDSGIAHPSTRFFIRRLRSGRLLLVKHAPPNGKDRDGVQGEDGVIRVVYDRERFTAREILMATFREEDVQAGKCVSADARLRIVVNRAGL